MNKTFNLQEEYRRIYDILQGHKTAEDYDRDFMSIINTCRDEGREEGRAEGREETTFAFVSAMLKKNMKLSDIMELSGLTEEKIKEIKSKI